MKDITVEKSKLLEILKKNRAAHREIFEEALEGYSKQAIKLFEENLARAKAGKKFQVYFQLTQPVDQTKDYDRAIGMLEMHEGNSVVLSEVDYRQYVQDDWNWKGSFLLSNSAYSAKAMFAMENGPEENQ